MRRGGEAGRGGVGSVVGEARQLFSASHAGLSACAPPSPGSSRLGPRVSIPTTSPPSRSVCAGARVLRGGLWSQQGRPPRSAAGREPRGEHLTALFCHNSCLPGNSV